MKKILMLVLAVVLCFSLVACGGSDKVVRTEEWVTDDGTAITSAKSALWQTALIMSSSTIKTAT